MRQVSNTSSVVSIMSTTKYFSTSDGVGIKLTIEKTRKRHQEARASWDKEVPRLRRILEPLATPFVRTLLGDSFATLVLLENLPASRSTSLPQTISATPQCRSEQEGEGSDALKKLPGNIVRKRKNVDTNTPDVVARKQCIAPLSAPGSITTASDE